MLLKKVPSINIKTTRLKVKKWGKIYRSKTNQKKTGVAMLITKKISDQRLLLEIKNGHLIMIVQFSSVTQSCPTLWDPMDCSIPGFPVLHYLPEFAQTQVHRVGDAMQPSHPLLSPSPPALNLSQHQGLFQWVSSSHWVAKVLELHWRRECQATSVFLPWEPPEQY